MTVMHVSSAKQSTDEQDTDCQTITDEELKQHVNSEEDPVIKGNK